MLIGTRANQRLAPREFRHVSALSGTSVAHPGRVKLQYCTCQRNPTSRFRGVFFFFSFFANASKYCTAELAARDWPLDERTFVLLNVYSVIACKCAGCVFYRSGQIFIQHDRLRRVFLRCAKVNVQ